MLERQVAIQNSPLGVRVFATFERGFLMRIRLEAADQLLYTPSGSGGEQEAVLISWLKAYSKGKEAPLPHLDLSSLSSFQRKVLLELLKVPFSKKISYGQLAKCAHHPGAARATGTACSKNPFPLLIPCHRVIHQNGSIGLYTGPKGIKDSLLSFENRLS